jgi:hypothetical protein
MPKRRSLLVALVMLLSLLPLVPGRAATSCDDAQVYAAFKGIPPAGIQAIQQDLIMIGHDEVKWVDGILGRRTTAALRRFCRDLTVDDYQGLPASLLVALKRYADFAWHNPDWRELVDEHDFESWLETQSVQRQSYFAAINKADGVLPITILADYRVATAPTPAKASVPPPDDSTVYYRLSAADFKDLKAGRKILQQLEGLKDVEYPNSFSLENAVEKALAESTESAGKYAGLALAKAQQNVSYRLTEASFDRLRIANIPEAALKPLQEIKNLPFSSRAKLENAVIFRLKPESGSGAGTTPPVQTQTDKPGGTANPTSVDEDQPQAKAPAGVEDQTKSPAQAEDKSQTDRENKTDPEAQAEVKAQAAAEDHPQDQDEGKATDTEGQPASKEPAGIEDQAGSQAPAETTGEAVTAAASGSTTSATAEAAVNTGTPDKPALPDYTVYAQQITAQAEKVRVYQLTADSFAKLGASPQLQAIPAALLDILGALQDVEFINRQLFVQAVHATRKQRISQYQKLVVDDAGETRQITQQTLNDLTNKGVPDYILEAIEPLQSESYADQEAFEKAVKDALEKLLAGSREQGFDEAFVQQAKKSAAAKLAKKPIYWDGGTCGCAWDRSDSEIYGFYPFWLTDQGEKPQLLDFSLLTRIGYYGLYLDQQGAISESRQWQIENAKDKEKGKLTFVEAADKYKVDLDLVVYTNAWQSWTEAEIDKAVDAVAEKMNMPLDDGSASRLSDWLPFVASKTATLGDGVTLYFDDFSNPEKAEARQKIADFTQKLRQALKANPRWLGLNLMIDIDWNEAKGQTLFIELSNLLTDKDKDTGKDEEKPVIDLLLVFLEAPTTDTKKALRRQIENEFKGEKRRTVLRKIVPIISPAGHDKELPEPYVQFTDDLIYFEDNFKGVGLWPLPLAEDAYTQEVNQRITETFKSEGKRDFMARMVDQYFPQLCNYVCPNRWLFRYLFDVLALALLLLVLVARFNCRLREWLKDNPWPALALLAAVILVFVISMLCDPYWKQRADDVIVGLLVAMVIIGLVRYIRKINQGPLP